MSATDKKQTTLTHGSSGWIRRVRTRELVATDGESATSLHVSMAAAIAGKGEGGWGWNEGEIENRSQSDEVMLAVR